jgi:hypothetical protein
MRRHLSKLALLAGLAVIGGLFGIGTRIWIGGLNGQHPQLEKCIRASQLSLPNEDTSSTMAHLVAQVPECMEEAGYEKALDNTNCGPVLWQGNVYCYLPKSFVGKLIYKIVTYSGGHT